MVRIVPAPHPGRGWECWWYFKLEGIRPGETLTLDVGKGVWATPDQAMFSLDNKTWTHTAPGQRQKDRIVYQTRIDAVTAWFAWGPPFVLADARALLQRTVKQSPFARTFVLAKSRDGHAVPALRVAQPGVADAERAGIWIEARQHAWESGASWVCQGFVEWLVSADPRAQALRQHASITVAPIMDADNVQRGAGGKNQTPQDHNRDWSDAPHWPEVRAAQARIKALDAAGRFDVFVDLHNPSASDREPYFYIAPRTLMSDGQRHRLDLFLAAAKTEMTGPLSYTGKTIESGEKYDRNWQFISKNWVTRHTRDHVVAVTLETAWNTPRSTAEGYQRVGRELGLAIERYLRECGTSPSGTEPAASGQAGSR